MKTTIATAALMVLMTAASLNAAPDTTWTRISKDLSFEAAVNLQTQVLDEHAIAARQREVAELDQGGTPAGRPAK